METTTEPLRMLGIVRHCLDFAESIGERLRLAVEAAARVFARTRIRLAAWRSGDFPSSSSLILAVASFLLCIIYLGVAAAHPSHRMAVAAVAIMEGVALVNLVFISRDGCRFLRPRQNRDTTGTKSPTGSGGNASRGAIRRNRLYTILTAIFTLHGIPLLYMFVWEPRLATLAIRQHEDTVDSVHYPAFAVWQRMDWTSQANITLEKPPKCFLGWHTEKAKPCNEVAAGKTCRCDRNWAPEILERFVWKDVEYRVAILWSSQELLCLEPTVIMSTQIYFTCTANSLLYRRGWNMAAIVCRTDLLTSHGPDNMSKAFEDSFRVLGPSLFVSIFDPKMGLLEALERNYTRLEHMPANGMNTVSLGLHHRQAVDEPGRYDYELSISSTPSTDLRCDSSNGSVAWDNFCWMTIDLSFPSFSRRVTEQDYKMTTTEAMAEAGAWFSLFQMIAWLLSGQALE